MYPGFLLVTGPRPGAYHGPTRRSPVLAAGHTCTCAASAGECGPAPSAKSESTEPEFGITPVSIPSRLAEPYRGVRVLGNHPSTLAPALQIAIEHFVQYYNHQRYHESLDNLTPVSIYYGKHKEVQSEREKIKRNTMALRRQQNLVLVGV